MKNCACKLTNDLVGTSDRVCPACFCVRLTYRQMLAHNQAMMEELGYASTEMFAYYDSGNLTK